MEMIAIFEKKNDVEATSLIDKSWWNSTRVYTLKKKNNNV